MATDENTDPVNTNPVTERIIYEHPEDWPPTKKTFMSELETKQRTSKRVDTDDTTVPFKYEKPEEIKKEKIVYPDPALPETWAHPAATSVEGFGGRDVQPISVEERARRRALKTEKFARYSRNSLSLEAVLNPETNEQTHWQFNLYTPTKEDGSRDVLDTYFIAKRPKDEDWINIIHRRTQKRVNELDLRDLATAHGREITITRMITESMTGTAARAPFISGIIVGAITAPLAVGTLTVANFLIPKHAGWLEGTWVGGEHGSTRIGNIPEIEETIVNLEQFEMYLRGTPVGEWLGIEYDNKNQIKTMELADVSYLLDEREGLPIDLLAINVAVESLLPTGAFVKAFSWSKGTWHELTQEASAIRKTLKKELDREPTVDEIGKQLKLRIKQISDDEIQNSEAKLINFAKRFKRDQVFQQQFHKVAYGRDIAVGEGLYFSSTLGLDQMMAWDIGGGYNTIGALGTSVFGAGILNALITGSSKAAQFSLGVIDPFLGFTKLSDTAARKAAINALSGGNEATFLNKVVRNRAQSNLKNLVDEPDPTDLLAAEKEIIKEYKGGMTTGPLVDWLKGTRNLDGIGLSSRQKSAALKFQKNFEQLSAPAKKRILEFMEKSIDIQKNLKELGIQNPDATFGMLFGLNTLRAIEPEMLMVGIGKQRKGIGRGLLNQISLEEFYQHKNAYKEALQKQYENIITARNAALKDPNRAHFISEDLQQHIESMDNMLTKLKTEAAESAYLIKAKMSLDVNAAKKLVNNKDLDDKVMGYINSLHLTGDEKGAIKQLELYEKGKDRAAEHLVRLVTASKEKTTIHSSRAIGAVLVNKITNLKNRKNLLYKQAGIAGDAQIVPGSSMFKQIKENFLSQSTASKRFKGDNTQVWRAIDEIFEDSAESYFRQVEQKNGLNKGDVRNAIKSELQEPVHGLGNAEIDEITNSSSRLLEFMIDNNINPGGMDNLPEFMLSGRDLNNIKTGLSQHIRSLGEQATDEKAWRKFGLIDIRTEVDNSIKNLENTIDDATGKPLLDNTKYREANEANKKYWDALDTHIVRKTWNTRRRFTKGEIGDYTYDSPIEKWGDVIFKDPKEAPEVYRELSRIFTPGSNDFNVMVDAMNMHALNLVEVATGKGVGRVERLLPYTVTKAKRRLSKDAKPLDTSKVDETMERIRALEKASVVVMPDGRKQQLFNFERAYNFEQKLTRYINEVEDSTVTLKWAESLKNEAANEFGPKIAVEWKANIDKFARSIDNFTSWVENPSKMVDAIGDGSIVSVKMQLKRSGMKDDEINKAVHALFVDGFVKKFTRSADQLKIIKKGKALVPVEALDGQALLKYLERHQKRLSEHIPALNKVDDITKKTGWDNLRYIAEQAAIDDVSAIGKRLKGVDDPTKGLARLTIGSYVSRLYAVASGRTTLRYVGAEAMVVQMKRDEIAVMAALMMNPKAASRVAELIKSGKPPSLVVKSGEGAWLPQFVAEVETIREEFLGWVPYVGEAASNVSPLWEKAKEKYQKQRAEFTTENIALREAATAENIALREAATAENITLREAALVKKQKADEEALMRNMQQNIQGG